MDSIKCYHYIVSRTSIAVAENKESSLNTTWIGYSSAILLFIVLCVASILLQTAWHHIQTVGLRVKVALVNLIYKKVCYF